MSTYRIKPLAYVQFHPNLWVAETPLGMFQLLHVPNGTMLDPPGWQLHTQHRQSWHKTRDEAELEANRRYVAEVEKMLEPTK